MKIFHFSDLHLDTPFTSSYFDVSLAQQCRLRLRRTLSKLLHFAQQQEVDIVTIGGDLFENDRVSKDTLHFIAENFAKIAPTPVYIVPGNHDFYGINTPYARYDWPDNVIIFTENKLRSVEITAEITLWGIAHTTPDTRESVLTDFRIPEDDKWHILLMHGSETGPFSEARAIHMPFTLQNLRDSGFKFSLLGHYHSAKDLPENAPIAVYPGTPQPLNFGETGVHSAILLTLDENGTNLKAFSTETQLFHTLHLDIAKYSNTDALAQGVLEHCGDLAEEANFLRLHLSGIPERQQRFDLDLLKEQLSETFAYIKIQDDIHNENELDDLAREPTVRGTFVRELKEKLTSDQEDSELVRLALKYGLQAFEGENITIK
ncbi:metallophosphoesterase [candidate division KSB1 bacterium]|nr:metallophosphoesterase [candidate division KSB1 bacterium]